MNRQLHADVVTLTLEDGTCTLGFATRSAQYPNEYLILQRAEDGRSDPGIYVEVDDQLYSGYGLVAHARAENHRLELNLKRPLGGTPAASFVVTFAESPTNEASVRRGVQSILFDVIDSGETR